MSLDKDRAITTKGAKALFVKGFVTRRRKLHYPVLCEVTDSHVENDFAKTIGTVPQLEEVIDGVEAPTFSDFVDYSWTWTNRLYRALIQIKRSLLDFDQTGQTSTLIQSMGARLANLPDKILATRLTNGTLYSGEVSSGSNIALFSTGHLAPQGSSTTQSNLITGTTSVAMVSASDPNTTAPYLIADLTNAIRTMRSFLDDQGEPWHHDDIEGDDLVIVASPLLAHHFRHALSTSRLNASDNSMKGSVRAVLTMNYLSQASGVGCDWYLFNVGQLNKPLVYSRFSKIKVDQIEDGPFDAGTISGEKVTLEDVRALASSMIETNLSHQGMNAESDVILNQRFLIGAQWRGEILGGEWRNAVKVNNN